MSAIAILGTTRVVLHHGPNMSNCPSNSGGRQDLPSVPIHVMPISMSFKHYFYRNAPANPLAERARSSVTIDPVVTSVARVTVYPVRLAVTV